MKTRVEAAEGDGSRSTLFATETSSLTTTGRQVFAFLINQISEISVKTRFLPIFRCVWRSSVYVLPIVKCTSEYALDASE